MNYYCPVCERRALDGNLYCERIECPAEQASILLDEGDFGGEFEIEKVMTILPSSAIYRANRHGEQLYLKIAHQGVANRERLKREALFLQKTAGGRHAVPYLPTLLAPYFSTATNQEVYGKVGLRGQLLYYSVFAHMPADALPSVLAKHAQLWVNHVGWLMLELSTVIAFLHHSGLYHFGLCPGAVLVRFDEQPPHVPRLLLVDLGIAADRTEVARVWYQSFLNASYTAPELIDVRSFLPKSEPQSVPLDFRVDVYGLGLLLYELLIGEPAFPRGEKTHQEVLQAVLNGNRPVMDRRDDVKQLADIALTASHAKLANRPNDAGAFGQELRRFFGDIPEEPKSRWPNPRRMLMVAGLMLAVAFVLTLVLLLT